MLYTTEKINFESIFDSDQSIKFKKYQKIKGKVVYQDIQIPVNQLDNRTRLKCAVLVSYLIQRNHFKATNQFVNIPKSTLTYLLGNGYQQVVSVLVQLEVIKVNESYSSNLGFSKSYAFQESMFGPITSHRLYERLYHLIESMTIKEGVIVMDDKGCITRPSSSEQGDILGVTPNVIQPFLKGYLDTTFERLKAQQPGLVIQPVKYSGKCGRFFTPITSMKKIDRSSMLSGCTTVDFKTSHLQHLIRMIETGSGTSVNQEEFRRFKIAVQEGDFYSSLNNGHPRDKNKKYVCCWLASSRKNWKGVQSLMGLYPSVTAFIDDFNAGTRNKLMNALMRSESNLINHTIIQHIAEHNPAMTVYGIHDALMCHLDDLDTVVSLIIHKGTEYLGFKPRFTIENQKSKPVDVQQPDQVIQPILVNHPKPLKPKKTMTKEEQVLKQLISVHGTKSKKVMEYKEQMNRMPRVVAEEPVAVVQPQQEPVVQDERKQLGELMKINQMKYAVIGDKVTLYFKNPESGMTFTKGDYGMMIKYVSFCNHKLSTVNT